MSALITFSLILLLFVSVTVGIGSWILMTNKSSKAEVIKTLLKEIWNNLKDLFTSLWKNLTKLFENLLKLYEATEAFIKELTGKSEEIDNNANPFDEVVNKADSSSLTETINSNRSINIDKSEKNSADKPSV